MWKRLARDIAHYRNAGVITHVGFWTGAAYRLTSACAEIPLSPVRATATTLARAVTAPLTFVRGVSIPSSVRIGPGLCLHHPQNVVIDEGVEIGEDCTLYQDVLIGRGGDLDGVPRLGDRVTIFAGAKVLGGITVGDDVQIGANAVVVKDVPAGAVVASPVGRPIPRETIEKMRGRS